MTREEAKRRIEIDLKCMDCDGECYDKHNMSICECNEDKEHLDLGEALELAIKALEQEPKTGHWILTDDDFVYCSECEDSYYPRPIDASWYYCPHCGCRMIEP